MVLCGEFREQCVSALLQLARHKKPLTIKRYVLSINLNLCRRPSSPCSNQLPCRAASVQNAPINNDSEILKFRSSADSIIYWAFIAALSTTLQCVRASWRLVYFQYFSFSCNSDLNPSAAALQSNYKPFSQMFTSETERKADLDFEVCSLKVLAKEEKPWGMCWTCSHLHIYNLTRAGRDTKRRIWSMCCRCWQKDEIRIFSGRLWTNSSKSSSTTGAKASGGWLMASSCSF